MSNAPIGRLKYKAKDGTAYEVGTFWDNGRGISLSPQKSNEDHEKWPKMKLSEAARRVEAGDGYLNCYMNDTTKPRQERREQPARGRGGRTPPPHEDFDNPDDDLPFN
jgi:hypothetical protein